MIDKNEMRIGNYFIGEEKVLWLSQIRHAENVKEWSYKGWHEETKQRIEVNFFEAEPIPLTTEILEKCGFVSNGEKFRPTFTHAGIYLLQIGHGYELVRDNNSRLFLGNVKYNYLHQLQNLYYALTQKELEINL